MAKTKALLAAAVATAAIATLEPPAPEVEVGELTKRQKFRALTVRLVAESNPKKKGSMSYDRFQDYFGLDAEKPPTIDWVLRNTSIRMDDIRHDSDHGFIQLGDAPVAGRPMVNGDL